MLSLATTIEKTIRGVLEYNSLALQKFSVIGEVTIPDEFGDDYSVSSSAFDIDNDELYCVLSDHSEDDIDNPTTFSGLVVINGKTNKYERKIDLRFKGIADIDLSNISVSRLRKVFVSSGLKLNSESIFCISDVGDSFVEQIYMPNINGAPVTRVTGTIVDNVRDFIRCMRC